MLLWQLLLLWILSILSKHLIRIRRGTFLYFFTGLNLLEVVCYCRLILVLGPIDREPRLVARALLSFARGRIFELHQRLGHFLSLALRFIAYLQFFLKRFVQINSGNRPHNNLTHLDRLIYLMGLVCFLVGSLVVECPQSLDIIDAAIWIARWLVF